MQLTAAPLAVKDKIVVGAAGGDRGMRDFIVALDAATGKLAWRKYVIPAPGEPGSETWKDKNNAWQTGGGAMWVTGSYDVAGNQVIWGTGNPVPVFDATYRPGDNLFTNSVISWNPDSGKMNWYFQYTPGDHWDYDEAGTHILVDGQVAGQPRKLITHSAPQRLPLYDGAQQRPDGAGASPISTTSTGPRASTRRPAGRSTMIAGKDIQLYSGAAAPTLDSPTKTMCPGPSGGNNFWPSTYSVKTRLIYIPTATPCVVVTQNPALSNKASDWKGGTYKQTERFESELTVADPFTGEVKKTVRIPYPNYSGTLSTAGGLVFTGFTDGTFVAYDDTTLDQLWKINVGTGFNAPPMTFEAGGKQYVAILAGLSAIARSKHQLIPELKDQRNQTMLFVFGL